MLPMAQKDKTHTVPQLTCVHLVAPVLEGPQGEDENEWLMLAHPSWGTEAVQRLILVCSTLAQ